MHCQANIKFFIVIWTTVLRTKTERRNKRIFLKRQLVSYSIACDTTEQSPSCQASSYWSSQEILSIYGTNIYIIVFTFSFHLILTWARSIHFTPWFFSLKIHFNIIFPFAPRSSKYTLSHRFLYQTSIGTFSLKSMCSVPFILPDLITQTVIGEDYNLWSSSLCILIRSKYRPNYHISDTLSLLSSINYVMTDNITKFYVF